MHRNYISFFQYFWKYPFLNDSSNKIFKGIVTDSLQMFIILIDILLYPCDLLESNDFIIDNISLFVTQKEFILVLVLYKRGGHTLLFFIEKKAVKKMCFFLQQSETKLPSIIKGDDLILLNRFLEQY